MKDGSWGSELVDIFTTAIWTAGRHFVPLMRVPLKELTLWRLNISKLWVQITILRKKTLVEPRQFEHCNNQVLLLRWSLSQLETSSRFTKKTARPFSLQSRDRQWRTTSSGWYASTGLYKCGKKKTRKSGRKFNFRCNFKLQDWYLKVYKKILNVARWLVILAQILLSQTDIKYSFDSFKDGGKGPNFSLP